MPSPVRNEYITYLKSRTKQRGLFKGNFRHFSVGVGRGVTIWRNCSSYSYAQRLAFVLYFEKLQNFVKASLPMDSVFDNIISNIRDNIENPFNSINLETGNIYYLHVE